MARFLSALGLSLVALVCRQTLPTLLVIHLGYAVTDYGNQGTTVDHGSVLLGTSLSGGGVYVGATRGRADNTIHIVADDGTWLITLARHSGTDWKVEVMTPPDRDDL